MQNRVIFLNIDDSSYGVLLNTLKGGAISFADVPVTEELLQVIEVELAKTHSRYLRRRILFLENPSYVDNQKVIDLLSKNFSSLEYAHVRHSGPLTLKIGGREYVGNRDVLKAVNNEILSIKHPRAR